MFYVYTCVTYYIIDYVVLYCINLYSRMLLFTPVSCGPTSHTCGSQGREIQSYISKGI